MSRKILRLPEVIDITGLSRSTIYEMIKNDRFPRQTKLSVRAVGWKVEEIDSWMDSLNN
jgi:prophage regulatory protein